MKKWRGLFISMGLALGIAFSSACVSKQAVVRAEGESEEIVEVIESEEEKSFFKKSYETYIVPLFAGMSLTSVVSLVICVAVTIVKTTTFNKKLLEINTKYNETVAVLAETQAILAEVKTIRDLVGKSDVVNTEVKDFVKEKMDYLVSTIDESASKIVKIDDVSKILLVLAQIQAKIAKQSPNAIKSGIIEDINKLLELVNNL